MYDFPPHRYQPGHKIRLVLNILMYLRMKRMIQLRMEEYEDLCQKVREEDQGDHYLQHPLTAYQEDQINFVSEILEPVME